MEHLVTIEHEGNRNAVRDLCEREDGVVVDSLSGEELSRQQVEDALAVCRANVTTLVNYLDRTSGLHPTLVAIKRDGFPEPEAEWGWSFTEEPVIVSELPHRPTLSITCRYEHDDDRGGQFEQGDEFAVVDGRFGVVDRRSSDLKLDEHDTPVDANDVEACQNFLTKYFESEGPG